MHFIVREREGSKEKHQIPRQERRGMYGHSRTPEKVSEKQLYTKRAQDQSGLSCQHSSHSNVNSEVEAIIRQAERDLTSTLANHYESLRIKTSGDYHCTTDAIEDLVSNAPPQVVHTHSTIYKRTMDNLTNYKQQRQASVNKKMVRDARLHQ